ncbi:MAG: type II toxin-antitoxin system RelB/DinJ family antitoxin, partial [Bacteroidales bacterium]|nr:type II toxin-antitoxin system RelB/DinJ family antitoxin [Bacteroidales bacterium]
MTVRMYSGIKAAFDALCAQFGMSANAAMNIFANAVVMQRRIPFAIKAAFDALCAQFGISANAAINIFANAVVMQRRIPFEIKAAPEEKSMSGLEAFQALRAEAEKNGLQEMNLNDINEEIRLAREERRAKRSVK